MKKILYLVTQSELGGAQRYILDLAKNLKHQYEISVAFGEPAFWNLNNNERRGEQGEKGDIAPELKRAGIKYFVLPHLKRAISPLSDLLAFFEIKKLIKKIRPDIIHLNSSKISILGSLACHLHNLTAKSYKLKTIYTAHGWVFKEPLPAWKKAFYFWAEKWTAKFKDKIICINKLDYQIAKNELKIKEGKLSVIYHGLDIKSYNFLSKEEAKRKIFSLIPNAELPPADTFLVGTIANLYPTKGLAYLIKALHILIIDYRLPITALIIGEGPERKRLEKLIRKFHPIDYNYKDGTVKNKIILTGRVPVAAELLPALDVYVSTSLKEGFPYSILEAMAAELPITATSVGGIPDMITDGQNGYLVYPKSTRTLARKIVKLIKDPGLRQKLGRRAKHDAIHRFTFVKMLEETKRVYES